MALMFPQLFPAADDRSSDDAAVFAALHAQLDDEWHVFYDRALTIGGEQGHFDFLLLHREHGVAILAVDVADEEIDAPYTIALMRRYLEEQGFPQLFAKPPAIVVLGVAPTLEAFGETLLARFAAAPRTRPADPDWVEWLADRLTVAADLASEPMIPYLVPDDNFFPEEAQPEFRQVAPPSSESAVPSPAEERLPYPAAAAQSDRGLVRALGVLTLFGALIGAVTLAATGVSETPTAVGALSLAPTTVAAAEPPAIEPLPVLSELAVPEEPRPEVAPAPAVERPPVHKPHKKRVAARRRPPEKSFWDRVADVFH